MAQDTSNTTPFIEAQRYDQFIRTNLHDGLLPDNMTRDVSGFSTGTTLNVKTTGTVTLQDVAEGVPMAFNQISTGSVTLSITEYEGDAWAISDKLKQDGSQIDQLQGARAMESIRALQESYETKFLAACNNAQTDASANNVNGFAHRFIGSGTNRTMDEDDLVQMSLAFNKAKAPTAGRIGIVDPVVAATFDKMVTFVNNTDMNQAFYGAWSDSFVQNHRFVGRFRGWDLFTSNYLPVRTSQNTSLTQGDGSADNAEIGDVANIFMCIADDNCRPMMRAWRVQPTTEGWRASEEREDRYQVTARYGFGAQRIDTLGVVFTHPTLSA